MSYFKRGLSNESKDILKLTEYLSYDPSITSTLKELEPYFEKDKDFLKKPIDYSNKFDAEEKLKRIKEIINNIPQEKRDKLYKAFTVVAKKLAIKLLQVFFLNVGKLAIDKFMMGRIKRSTKNRLFTDYIEENKRKIESKRPELIPSTIDEFRHALFYEKLFSNFREKNTKQVIKTIARMALSKTADIYDIITTMPFFFMAIPAIAKRFMKYRIELAMFRILKKIFIDNKEGEFDRDIVHGATVSDFEISLLFAGVKIALGMYGINLGLVNLYSRLCSYKGHAMMVRVNLTPKGLRMNDIELIYYKHDPDNGSKVFYRKAIPDPPESIYQVSMSDIKKEAKMLSNMNTSRELDKYAKGLLKDANESVL